MNQVILTGNLTRDPEPRTFESNGKKVTVVNFTVASSRHFKKRDGTADQETLFMDCEAWDTGAETIVKYMTKGSKILVEGSLKNETWEDKETKTKRSKTKIRVNRFEFFSVNKKRDESEGGEAVAVGAGAEDSGGGDTDAEIPF